MPWLSADEERRRLEVYGRGLTDRQAAQELGINHTTFTMWRQRWGLPPNDGSEPEDSFPRNVDQAIELAAKRADVLEVPAVIDELEKILPVTVVEKLSVARIKKVIERLQNKKPR